MATDANERLNQWLQSAHAMEQQAEQMLKAQSNRIESYPQLQDRLERHLAETQSQRERLEGCLSSRGISASGMKDAAAQVTAFMQAAGGSMAADEVVKGSLASYTFEHFEIGTYRSLIAAADAVGDAQTARVCSEILQEEEAMAGWLEEHIPEITRSYLARSESSTGDAKR